MEEGEGAALEPALREATLREAAGEGLPLPVGKLRVDVGEAAAVGEARLREAEAEGVEEEEGRGEGVGALPCGEREPLALPVEEPVALEEAVPSAVPVEPPALLVEEPVALEEVVPCRRRRATAGGGGNAAQEGVEIAAARRRRERRRGGIAADAIERRVLPRLRMAWQPCDAGLQVCLFRRTSRRCLRPKFLNRRNRRRGEAEKFARAARRASLAHT